MPRTCRPSRSLRVVAQASSTDDVGAAGLAGIAVGLISNPVVAFSLYTLKTTGAGLPPGPGGLYGAIGTDLCTTTLRWVCPWPPPPAVATAALVHTHSP